ncbi:hypothetical protein GJ744_002793 [Endocarpon pusillum]|uniref:Uncharacterized protein n=1 Tax=Endocarpon pusillum TaxID=364733 RepID=A0A8H7E886_9EURO|nr:hypothetical protein GJ744_002793 [Endocarpon pusillum]
MGIADKIPPNLKFAILGLTIPIFTLYVLVLVGCVSTSPGIPSLYLFLLKVNEITLRVGYFAVCAVDTANTTSIPVSQNGTANATDGTICVPTVGLNSSDLSIQLFGNSGDVVPILDLALTLQREILVPLVLVATFLMLFGAIFFALVKVTQMKLKNPSAFEGAMKQLNIFKPATLATLWTSVLFAFAAAVASTMGIGALNFIIPVLATNISVDGGKVLQALQYMSFILGALFALGATVMLGDQLEQQQGVLGDEYSQQNEKAVAEQSYEEQMMQQQGQMDGQMEGMEGQEQQYPDGAYGEEGQQYPNGAYGEEGQQYAQEMEGQEYAQQQEGQYAGGDEYAQAEYAQQQQLQQQQQYPQQPYAG